MKRVIKTAVCALILSVCLAGCGGEKARTSHAPQKGRSYVSQKKITNVLIEPDNYKNKWIKIKGQVSQGPDVDGKKGYMVRYVEARNRYFFVQSEEDLGFKEEDYIAVDGKIDSEVTIKNVYGDDIPVVSIGEASIKKASYKDVEVPAYTTKKAKKPSLTQEKVKFTLEKIEYANEETRVYIKIQNKSNQIVYFDPAYIILSQDDVVVNSNVMSSSIENGNYPQVDSAIEPGKSSSGIVVFSVISSQKGVDVICTLYDAQYRQRDYSISVQA